MAKFLDYEGLGKYNDIIVGLIKGGDDNLLKMINDIKDAIEGSDVDSVANQIAALDEALGKKIADLEAKHDDEKEALDAAIKDVKDSVDAIVDGAPETLDTLKEIAAWIASDEAGVANLISDVAANRADINAAAVAYEKMADKIAIVEAMVGVDGGSDGESLADRIDDIEANIADASLIHDDHADRIAAIENALGVDGESDGDSISDRVKALEDIAHDEPEVISDADIDALFA